MKKILIIGGPQFIGRNLLEALDGFADWEITLFNRGKTNADLFAKYPRIIGDRNTDDIQQIAAAHWDYVIDIACYQPASLEAALKHINKNIKNYIFISTVSVYKDEEGSSYEESCELLSCSEEQATDKDIMPNYGQKKAECERILMRSGLPYTILRPGLIYGPYDRTDRFYYWLYQAHQSTELLIPEQGHNKVSYTYVKDLAKVIIDLISNEHKREAIYNTITSSLSILDIVKNAERIMEKNLKLFHAPIAFLQKENIQYWSDLPLWLDHDAYWSDHIFKRDFGFLFTDVPSSIADSISYYNSIDWPSIKLSGLKDKEYGDLLTKYQQTIGN